MVKASCTAKRRPSHTEISRRKCVTPNATASDRRKPGAPLRTLYRDAAHRELAPLSGFPLSGFPLSGFSLSGFSLSGFSLSGFPLSGFSLSGFSLSGFSLSGFSLELQAKPNPRTPPSNFPLILRVSIFKSRSLEFSRGDVEPLSA